MSKAVRQYLWRNSAEGKANQKALEDLRNKYTGRRCFIMGNGPSLKLCDLTLLKNEITIGSNAQFLIWNEMGYAPTFLTVEDRLVAEDRAKELNAIKETVKIFPFDLSYCLLKDEKTIFINFVRQYQPFPQFSNRFEKRVYWGGTVTFLNIQLAYYLGCNPIYLIGLDHNYKVPKKIENSVIISEEDDVNHIHPDYFGTGYRWHDPNVERMEQSYMVAREFLNAKKIQIFNASVGGKLEVFERINYDELKFND
ncbi:MAG: 6-hydroxymethylpterin diphosphokinase MptE-like protein [Stygiobacter sp.]